MRATPRPGTISHCFPVSTAAVYGAQQPIAPHPKSADEFSADRSTPPPDDAGTARRIHLDAAPQGSSHTFSLRSWHPECIDVSSLPCLGSSAACSYSYPRALSQKASIPSTNALFDTRTAPKHPSAASSEAASLGVVNALLFVVLSVHANIHLRFRWMLVHLSSLPTRLALRLAVIGIVPHKTLRIVFRRFYHLGRSSSLPVDIDLLLWQCASAFHTAATASAALRSIATASSRQTRNDIATAQQVSPALRLTEWQIAGRRLS